MKLAARLGSLALVALAVGVGEVRAAEAGVMPPPGSFAALRMTRAHVVLSAAKDLDGGARAGGPVAVAADPARLERIYAEHELTTAPPRASWTAYVGHLGERFSAWLMRALTAAVNRVLGSSPAWQLAVYATIAMALLALLLWLLLLLRSGARRLRAGAQQAAAGVSEQALPAGETDAAAWRTELDRRLAAGDLPAALRAAWWWLARSLAGPRVNPAWTSRELLAAAERADLAPAVRGLDALLYGVRPPERAAVERAVARVTEELGH